MPESIHSRDDLHVRIGLGWWILLLLACTHFCLAYFQNDKSFLDLDDYVHGKSLIPYQYRALMAWVLGVTDRFQGLAKVASHVPAPLNSARTLVLFASSWMSLFGSVLLTWRSLAHLTEDEEFSRWASLLVIYMAYFQYALIFGPNFLLPYDLPSLFFFCGCLYTVISRRMLLFYLFFIIGTWNRETTCMATLLLLLWRFREIRSRTDSTKLVGHLALQTFIWLAIKAYLRHKFGGNPIEPMNEHFPFHLIHNLHKILKPQQWPVLSSVFGFTLPVVFVWRRWMKNPAMERGLFLVAIWISVMLIVGVINEIRIFGELIGYMTLALGLILYHRFFESWRYCDFRRSALRSAPLAWIRHGPEADRRASQSTVIPRNR